MPRTFTVDERNAIASGHYDAYGRLELRDSEGNWVDVSTSFTSDFLNTVTIETTVDDNCWQFSAELLREALGVSLSPLMEASAANRDSSDEYAPFLDVSRQWRMSAAIVPHGTTLLSAHWHPVGEGTYDVIQVDSPRPTIRLRGRDLGATLLDLWIVQLQIYGDNDNPVPMETVLQQMLDDLLGPGAITLYVPTSPSFLMEQHDLTPNQSLMTALNSIAKLAGMVVRYRYDANDDFRLTLYAPDRDAEAADGEEDWTLGPSEYLTVPEAKLDLSGVRNRVEANYWDAAAGLTSSVNAVDTDSIARFGGPHGIQRTMSIDLPLKQVWTAERAQAIADAILSDVAFPPFLHQYETTGFWIAQLGDWGRFLANGVHYDTNQFGGVTSIRHTFANGNMRTLVRVGGQPRGRYRLWTADRNLIRGRPELRIRNFRDIARSDTTVTYGWETQGLASELWLWIRTYPLPVPSDPWPSVNSVPSFRLTPATASFEFDLPLFGSIVYAQLCAVDEQGQISQPWQFTITSESAPRLVQQVIAHSTSPTSVTLRAYVADPQPAGPIVVTPSAVGTGGISPAGAQTIPRVSVTADIATTSYVEWTVTRPAFQAGTGRVTFVASAADRITDIDAVEVPSQDGPGPVMDVVATPGATAYTITYSVTADSFQYSVDGAAYTSVPASGFSVSRNLPGGATKNLTFRATRNSQTATAPVSVPPQELSAALALSLGPGAADLGASTLTVTWTASNMPSGTTFNIGYDNGGLNIDSADGATSPHVFTGVVFNGTPPSAGTGALFVDAVYNGRVIASAKRHKVYAT